MMELDLIPDLNGGNKKNLRIQAFNGWMGIQRMQKKSKAHKLLAYFFGKYGLMEYDLTLTTYYLW